MSLGGGTRRGNNYTLDGVPITDMRNRQSANPTIEALDDVKVQVHTYDAEMGRTGGGVFNTTLKSGTNKLPRHRLLPDAPGLGRGEQLLQPDQRQVATAAGNTTVAAQNAKPDSVVLPARRRHRRTDREGSHLLLVRRPRTTTTSRRATCSVTFPNAAERAGDFSGLVNASGASSRRSTIR